MAASRSAITCWYRTAATVVGQRGNDGVGEHDRPAPSGALRRADRECAVDLNKAGPAGGRLRRPPSRRQRHDGHRGTGLTLHAAGTLATRQELDSYSPSDPSCVPCSNELLRTAGPPAGPCLARHGRQPAALARASPERPPRHRASGAGHRPDRRDRRCARRHPGLSRRVRLSHQTGTNLGPHRGHIPPDNNRQHRATPVT